MSFRRYWFLYAMAVVLLLGLALPEGAPFIRSRLTLPLVASILFMSGLSLDLRNVLRQARNTPAIALSLVTTYVAAPAVAYGLARISGPPLDGPRSEGFLYLQAMMLAAAQATTLAAAVVMSKVARGDQELAIVLTLLSNALSAVLTPLVLQATIGSRVALPIGDMMGRMALAILLPLLAGHLVRRLVWRAPSPRSVAVLRVLPQLVILSFMYTALASAADRLRVESTLALRFLAACAVMHVTLLAWSALCARLLRLTRAERTTMLFSGPQKTVPNGMYLWSRFFADNPYGAVPLVLHQVLQLGLGTLLATRLGDRALNRQDSGKVEGEVVR